MKSPITKSLTVPLSVTDAFALFADNIDTW